MESTAQVHNAITISVFLYIDVPSFHLFLCPADINECENGEDNCHRNAECTDTIGSYNCSCNSGYSGNGFKCIGK